MTERSTVVAAVLAIAVVASAAIAPVAATAGDGAGFEESIATVRAGEVATVAVDAAETGAAHRIAVGSNESNFRVRATVVDADADGRVALRIDTTEAGVGNASSYLSASDGDELRAAEQVTPTLPSPVDPGHYDLTLGPADDPIDVATLVAEDPTRRPSDAPPLPGDPADSDAITVLPSEERLTVEPAANRTIRGETTLPAGTNLSVRVRSESGRAYLAAASAEVNESGGFAAAFDFDVADPGSTFALSVTGPNGTREAVPGRVDGTWVPPETESPRDSDDESPGEAPLPGDGADSDAITVLPSEERLSLEAGVGRVVRGETTLPPGAELTVRLRSVEGRPFLKSVDAEVGEFGTFDARYDLDGIEPGTTFALTVRGPDGTEERVPGRVVACESDCDAPEATAYPVEGFGVIALAETTQGRVGRLPIRLGERETATLVIGGESVGYEAGITVRDENGDGRVVVGFDTGAAGHEDRTLAVVSDGDAGEIAVEETDLSRLIGVGEYPVALYAGTEAGGESIDNGTLVIYEPSSAVGTDATPAPTADPSPAGDGDRTDPIGGPLDSQLAGAGGLALGGALAFAGVALILRRQ